MNTNLSISECCDLSSKTALVTGGAVGIGLGIVHRLAEAGASVGIADINGNAAARAAEDLQSDGRRALAVQADVANTDDVDAVVKKTVEEFGHIDILVNNAGIYPNTSVLEMTEEDFERVLDINLKGTFLCTKAAASAMIKQGSGGKIINISSIDALHPSMTGLAAYDASKHGMWGFTKNTALELAEHGIWVNAVAPGAIATPGTGAMGGDVDPAIAERMDQFAQEIPMKRIGDPDEIGKVVLFLASDLSSYMTGSQIVADGGALLT
ncbi:MAG: SDR family NAD(P)-dependent oxidoreductase [Candidatus Paceibacterota bacterium]